MKSTSMCENSRIMPDRVTRPFVFADNLSRQTLPGYAAIVFPRVDGMEQENEEQHLPLPLPLLFQPDSAPLPCSHVRNTLNVRFPIPWVAIGGPTPWLSLNPVLSSLDL